MTTLAPELLTALAPYGRYGVETRAPLAGHTSFRIGGPAEALLTVQHLPDLLAALELLGRHDAPFVLLGGGSNVLVSDAGVPGLVILNQCRQVSWPAHSPTATPAFPRLVRAEAGVPLAGLARAAIKRNLAGLAWAVSVPGAVGGAVVGNAGAHGGCVADNLHSIELWQQGRIRTVPADELDFAYRSSRLKRDVRGPGLPPVVLSATFALQADANGAEAERAASYIAHRRRTQPVDKSAGSIFKNPPGDFAGRLIEAAGLKGERAGDASVSQVHANFIINEGAASAADVVTLMNRLRAAVFDRFGVVLEPEIQFLGDWSAGPALAPLHPQPQSLTQP